MRAIFETQFELGHTPIGEISFDPRSRDDIPAVLRGLQDIFTHRGTRERVFAILREHLGAKVDLRRGRPGLCLWRIFVLGTLQKALDCDFDRLVELANFHTALRQMLGHADFGDKHQYRLQTVIDNVRLLTEEALQQINAVVVARGHQLLKHKNSDPLHCRADSAVAKTHVEWPTDVRLLWDALRRLIRKLARLCQQHAIAGWRKSQAWIKQIERAFYQVRTSRQWRSTSKVADYLALCRTIVSKAAPTQAILRQNDVESAEVSWYLRTGGKLIDQVSRRLIKGEKIPHGQKLFSVHEPHTRWINKGKAGVMAELGVPVCVLEDQHQFILRHYVQHEGGDQDMIVPFLAAAKRRYPALASCSMDKGFYTPANREALDELLDLNVMPKKGRHRKADRERETHLDFVAARRQHPAVESAINNLHHRGMSLVRTHGKAGFDRTLALVVVATNVHRIGQVLKQKEARRRKWRQARSRAQ